jgi:hypothetical protein
MTNGIPHDPEPAKTRLVPNTLDWDGWFSASFDDHFSPAIDEVIKVLGEECGLIEKGINDKIAELDARLRSLKADVELVRGLASGKIHAVSDEKR